MCSPACPLLVGVFGPVPSNQCVGENAEGLPLGVFLEFEENPLGRLEGGLQAGGSRGFRYSIPEKYE